jgi:ubiquinone/menaquinone biosynthesis C-methylase UbiE
MTTMSSDGKFWDGTAEKYAKRPVGDPDAFERKKRITRDHLTPDSTVLEIGCGTGTLALEMAPFARHIHAMDISAEMLRIANAKKRGQAASNVTFHRGTLDQAAQFEPEHFDAAWAYSILHLVDDRRRTLETLYALLKPGGTFISSNVCLGNSWVPYGALIAVMRWFGKAPKVHIYDRETILREMREVGFVNVKEHDVAADGLVAFIVAERPTDV